MTYDEPQMLSHGGNEAVVMQHDAQAFEERFALVLGGHSFREIIGKD